MEDPKVIYLGPACQKEGDGREWCEDDVWTQCECGCSSVRYTLESDAQSELAALREEPASTTSVARSEIEGLSLSLQRCSASLTAAEQRNSALAQQASKAFESAARWVESRRDDYVNYHGSIDPGTGTVEFPGNGEEYVGELDEIAEGLRSLKLTESGASE